MSVLHEKNFQSPPKKVAKRNLNFSLDLKNVKYSPYEDDQTEV